jgi:hypothetical protein
MYMTGISYHLKRSEAVKLAAIIRPEGGKCLLRQDPLGTIDLITLSPKPMYSGQEEFVERRNDAEA